MKHSKAETGAECVSYLCGCLPLCICVVLFHFVFVWLLATLYLCCCLQQDFWREIQIGLRLWRLIYDCAGLYSNVLNNEGKLERVYHSGGGHNFSKTKITRNGGMRVIWGWERIRRRGESSCVWSCHCTACSTVKGICVHACVIHDTRVCVVMSCVLHISI